ncbi:MAG: hypothetical protein LBS99_04475 [Clostridiales bacterium]|nr:hypothetical protein [Clostridiales bacterium]
MPPSVKYVDLRCSDKDLLLRELFWSVGYLQHGASLGLLKTGTHIDRAELLALKRDIEALNAEYKAIWRKRNKESNIALSVLRQEALYRKYCAILDVSY